MDNKIRRLSTEESSTRKVTVISSTNYTSSLDDNNNLVTRTRVNYTEEEFFDSRRKQPGGQSQKRKVSNGAGSNEDFQLQLFLNLSSNDPEIRLDAFKKLGNAPNILKVLEEEICKWTSPVEVRMTALKKVGGMVLEDSADFHRLLMKLLRLSTEDESHLIRLQALWGIESLVKANCKYFEAPEDGEIEGIRDKTDNSSSSNSNDSYVNTLRKQTDSVDDYSPLFSVLDMLPTSLNLQEIIFSLLSHIAANDTHRQVRLAAMELIGKIPSMTKTVRPEILFLQSVKKDQIKRGKAGKSLQSQPQPPVPLPLLVCGVFAHGIEDQFVKIRFAALKSLFNLYESSKAANVSDAILPVFLDALLDECDLIRLASLKFIKQIDKLALSVNSGLDSLLAVLDDQNSEIRLEALGIIGDKLTLTKIADPNMSLSATCNEILLRIQRCMESAVQKFPEMEFAVLESSLNLMNRLVAEGVKKTCPEFWAQLMQSPQPKMMKPASLLPYNTTYLSNVQSTMQIPFLEPNDRKVRLVKTISRIQGSCAYKDLISVLLSAESASAEPAQFKLSGNAKRDHLQMLLHRKTDVSVRFMFDKKFHPQNLKFYHISPGLDKPVAFFKIKSISAKSDKITIEDYELIGSIESVRLDLIQGGKQLPFELRYGQSKFVAKSVSRSGEFKILNATFHEIIWEQ